MNKRPYLLLEVMMAFFLVVLCAIPLLYPHAYMLRAEKNYVKTIQLDRAVDLVHANVLENLYKNEISWDQIVNREWRDIETSLLTHDPMLWQGLPYKGRYMVERKPKTRRDDKEGNIHFINLEFISTEDLHAKPLIYRYHVPIKRHPLQTDIEAQHDNSEPMQEVEEIAYLHEFCSRSLWSAVQPTLFLRRARVKSAQLQVFLAFTFVKKAVAAPHSKGFAWKTDFCNDPYEMVST